MPGRPHPDRDEPGEVVWRIGKRLLLLAAPLSLVGWLLAALGIPVVFAVIAMLVALVIVVFELDL